MKVNHLLPYTILVLFLGVVVTEGQEVYDAIVIGGGAGGCVAAQAMVERNKKVLLLERGGDAPAVSLKSEVFSSLNERKNKCMQTLDGAGVVMATGNCLGGATPYNQAIWIEERNDFLSEFGGLVGNETMVGEAFDYLTAFFAPKPTKQTNADAASYINQLIEAFDAQPSFDIANVTPGVAKVPLSGIWRPHSAFDPDTGIRRSADQILDRSSSNLVIRLNSQVEEIIFESNVGSIPTARCVKYIDRNGLFRSIKEVCVKVGGRIFLAAGAFYTPALLIKSGIGEGGKVYNNDQVGKNLSDKPFAVQGLALDADKSFPTPTVGEFGAYIEHTLSSGKTVGLLWEEISVHTKGELTQFAIFEREFADTSSRFSVVWSLIFRRANRISLTRFFLSQLLPKTPLSIIVALVATPQSTGQVTLDRNGKLQIDPNYLSSNDDAEALGAAIRISRAATANLNQIDPDNIDGLSDLEIGMNYKPEIISPYHFAGTAAIGKVVDNQLKVLGVEGLYVADASALPRTPRVNAMPSAMLIGRIAGSSFE